MIPTSSFDGKLKSEIKRNTSKNIKSKRETKGIDSVLETLIEAIKMPVTVIAIAKAGLILFFGYSFFIKSANASNNITDSNVTITTNSSTNSAVKSANTKQNLESIAKATIKEYFNRAKNEATSPNPDIYKSDGYKFSEGSNVLLTDRNCSTLPIDDYRCQPADKNYSNFTIFNTIGITLENLDESADLNANTSFRANFIAKVDVNGEGSRNVSGYFNIKLKQAFSNNLNELNNSQNLQKYVGIERFYFSVVCPNKATSASFICD